jgi:hypothetical protein
LNLQPANFLWREDLDSNRLVENTANIDLPCHGWPDDVASRLKSLRLAKETGEKPVATKESQRKAQS